jgi:subtilisin family serine protease
LAAWPRKRAWNWCITHKTEDPDNPILVISTSYGGGRYQRLCDADNTAYAVAAANAVSAGITLLVSSGNEGFCDSVVMPACISSVISVGAVFDVAYGNQSFCINPASCAAIPNASCSSTGFSATDPTAPDKVASYSNTAEFLGVLAPAHRAHTTDILGAAGYSGDDYNVLFGGTSAATPYVAGAVAALQSAARALGQDPLTPAEVRALLTSTGDPLIDAKATQIVKPRVNLGRAIEALTPYALSATRVDDRVIISWPTNAAGYVLQWAHALPAATWSNMSATPVTVGTNRYVTNTVTPGEKRFYRLRK